jgi:predicted phosphodiesterase
MGGSAALTEKIASCVYYTPFARYDDGQFCIPVFETDIPVFETDAEGKFAQEERTFDDLLADQVEQLWVGDTHISVGENNSRFFWLAELIEDLFEKDSGIINFLGDLVDAESLYNFEEKDADEAERLYREEMARAEEALDILEPKLKNRIAVLLAGNHDQRINEKAKPEKFTEKYCFLYNINFTKFGIKYIEYKKVLTLGRFQYSHKPSANFSDGYIAIHGHTHELSMNYSGTMISVGCFFENSPSHYINTENFYRGVVALGKTGLWAIPIGTMKARYGSSTTTTDSQLILPAPTWTGKTQPALIAVAARTPQPLHR